MLANLAVGSSKTIRRALLFRALNISTFCCSATDNEPTIASGLTNKLKCFMTDKTFSFVFFAETKIPEVISLPIAILSTTVLLDKRDNS